MLMSLITPSSSIQSRHGSRAMLSSVLQEMDEEHKHKKRLSVGRLNRFLSKCKLMGFPHAPAAMQSTCDGPFETPTVHRGGMRATHEIRP